MLDLRARLESVDARGDVELHEALFQAPGARERLAQETGRFGDRRCQLTVIGDVTQAAYLGPWLWKAAVEKAGSFDVDKVREASPGIELTTAPEGYVKVHENHHLWSKTRVGRAQADGQYDVVFETAELVEPDPFPEGYQ